MSGHATIRGVPVNGQGKIIQYSFSLTHWFIKGRDSGYGWDQAQKAYSDPQGYHLPTIGELTNAPMTGARPGFGKRGVGNLWSEWGDLYNYEKTGFTSTYNVWTSYRAVEASEPAHYLVGLGEHGTLWFEYDRMGYSAVFVRNV